MSFLEIRFPTAVSKGAEGGPEFRTLVSETRGGHEQRAVAWDDPRRRYSVDLRLRDEAQKDEFLTFFLVTKGAAHAFRFQDPTDYRATGQNIGTGDGADTTYQLRKIYTNAAGSYTRVINKPVANTVAIYFDATPQPSGWTVDTTTGIVTFDAAPANGVVITADFQFDVPVRLVGDWPQISREAGEVYNWRSIELVEERL